ncbi:MAG: EF-hand domain-containing protein [Pseudomonadota bacterium]
MLKKALLTVALSGFATAGFAQMITDGDDMPRFERIDTDGSGSISQAEMRAVREMMFARADRDGDGAISGAEITAMQDRMRARVEMRIARSDVMADRLDANGDGLISVEEFDTPRPAFGFLDTDGDGEISAGELTELRARLPVAQP